MGPAVLGAGGYRSSDAVGYAFGSGAALTVGVTPYVNGNRAAGRSVVPFG